MCDTNTTHCYVKYIDRQSCHHCKLVLKNTNENKLINWYWDNGNYVQYDVLGVRVTLCIQLSPVYLATNIKIVTEHRVTILLRGTIVNRTKYC